MLKYICVKRNLNDHWYPTSEQGDQGLKERMDAYLQWHDKTMRLTVVRYIYATFF
jgi:hypothetical protein